jgi:hypothetical protein
MSQPTFLADLQPRRLTLEGPFQPIGLVLGSGPSALEVAIARAEQVPTPLALRTTWKKRLNARAVPLLLVVLHGERASLCGPAGDDPPAHVDLDRGQVERICREALQAPDRHAAHRALRDSLPAVTSPLCGIRNEGFLATHELQAGARQRDDWTEATKRGRPVLQKRGHDQLKALGFHVEQCDRVTSILRSADQKKVGIAVLLESAESPDLQADRFSMLSPIAYALSVADRESLPYVIVQHGAKLRIYPTRMGVGVGRRGRSETYVECHTTLLRDEDAAFVWLLCSADALRPDGSLEQLLADSKRFAGDLADQLRERIYDHVVPTLAEGIVAARKLKRPTAQDLADTYEMTLTVLFRLLFIAYAEDKNLLPYEHNGLYQRRSLKTKAQELLELARYQQPFDTGTTRWSELQAMFRAVDVGNRDWGVPAYNGGLFTADPDVSRVGALLADIELPDTIVGPALRDLLLVETESGLGPVDFRSLGVREFGTIYEGLLESELSIAETDLGTDKDGNYRPAKGRDEVLVRQGHVYLHNASGARKSSGSYFTKSFAVEHLLDRALEPALKAHFERLKRLPDDEAAAQFFDFRVADIAMGSAHFLVAAVDHIERAFTGYLAERRLQGVLVELGTLREAAVKALDTLAPSFEIEDNQLLRRLIARRCIYGCDINPVSVQLARLAIWIHTFVPGLPLSLLDHNLVWGNSLVGVARLTELEKDASGKKGGGGFFSMNARKLLGAAEEHLQRLARIVDTTPAEVGRARNAMLAAKKSLTIAEDFLDTFAASRVLGSALPMDVDQWEKVRGDVQKDKDLQAMLRTLRSQRMMHFPVAFPEVFLRSRPGFDVILGNPPWQETTLEEDAFWARHSPGMRALPQREQEKAKAKLRKERPDLVAIYDRELAEADTLRRCLVAGPFPGMGTGDPDLYKAFCWRFWDLTADCGWIGVVVPRSALSAKGSTEFRQRLFGEGDGVDITTLLNTKGWVFDEAEHRYTIGLVAFQKRRAERTPVALRGPYASRESYGTMYAREAPVFYGHDIRKWNDTASLPLLPSEDSVDVFGQLRKSPRLDLDDMKSWRARPHAELHATNDKGLMDLKSKECPNGFWPVFKGESFDIWTPDTGTYYAWADPETMTAELQNRRVRSLGRSNSAYGEFPKAVLQDKAALPCLHARIAFRDVTRSTDTRTVRAALLPPRAFLTNKGPFLLWPRGDAKDQAYLLGVLCSLPLDWYARRFVEINLNYFIFNPMPVPRPPRTSPHWQRVVEIAGRLACPDERFRDWAKAVGTKCGPLGVDEKDDKIRELDAVVAHCYGLQQKHLVHVFETFHEGWDYEERLRDTLKHFKAWKERT